jgi:hypothetical protein
MTLNECYVFRSIVVLVMKFTVEVRFGQNCHAFEQWTIVKISSFLSSKKTYLNDRYYLCREW